MNLAYNIQLYAKLAHTVNNHILKFLTCHAKLAHTVNNRILTFLTYPCKEITSDTINIYSLKSFLVYYYCSSKRYIKIHSVAL